MLRDLTGTMVPHPVLVQENLYRAHGGIPLSLLEKNAIAWSQGSGQTGPGQAITILVQGQK